MKLLVEPTLDKGMMNPKQTRRWLFAALAWCFCIGMPADAWAEPYAVVQSIAAPDARGQWRPVTESAAAVQIKDDKRIPLRVGMGLALGDRVVTEEARVTLGIGDAQVVGQNRTETITVSAGGDITIKERSVLQRMGEVYYQVRDMFSVDYGTVQTAVEGTEFSIAGAQDGVKVAVTEGVVRVSNAGSSVRVKRGQELLVGSSAAPPAPSAMVRPALLAVQKAAWSLGRPRLQVGLLGTGGWSGDEGSGQLRAFGSVRLLPMVNLVGEGAFGLDGGGRFLNGSGLGLETNLMGVQVGGSFQYTVERRSYECGARYAAAHLGGNVHARINMNITRRFFLVASGRAGGDGRGVTASGGFGAGVSL